MMACHDIDENMMEFLYRELDAEKAQAFQTHVETCGRCHAELSSLQKTRQSVRALPEREPPPAVSARLLHEAALRASPGAKASVLSRLFGWVSPLGLHPALAAVASLVLVAGVAGLLLKDKVSPTLETLPSSPVEALAPGGAAPSPSEAPPPSEGEAASEVGAALPAPSRVGRLSSLEEKKPPAAQDGENERRREVDSYRSDEKTEGKKAPSPRGVLDEGRGFADKPASQAAPAREADDFALAPPPRAPEPSAASQGLDLPPAPTQDPTEKKARQRTKAEAFAPSPATQEPVDAKRLHGQARAAAETGDCKRANELKARVAKVDSEYFRLKVYSDQLLGRCDTSTKVQRSTKVKAAQPPSEK
jgi:hypothetical protein